MSEAQSGARIMARQLLLQGVNHVFCVPGESLLGLLDALGSVPGLRVITNRHESASTFMAASYARLTAQPGVALVARGPGACNAAIGLHSAAQDGLPLVVIAGQCPGDHLGREAFQEIDLRQLFAPVCKQVLQAERAARLPELVARAFQAATSGRPGPVALIVPEDVLDAPGLAGDARCHQPVQSAPSDTQIASLRRLLGRAQRPLVVAGGTGWTASASENLGLFAQANRLPVVSDFRWQDVLDNRHPNYVGCAGLGMDPRLADRLRGADLVLALGTRLGEATTGRYALLEVPVPRQALVHAFPGVDELGSVYQADLLINTGMPQLAARLAMMTPIDEPPWAGELVEARAHYVAWCRALPARAPLASGIDAAEVITQLRTALPDDAIVASGAGNFAAWLHRWFPSHACGTQLAPSGGGMGYAVPAAIAAKLAAPEKTVVCVSGDGDFLMSGHELATAAQLGTAVVFLVFNNGQYGTIRSQQERRFPGRPVASALTNPDFAALAQAYGFHGATVTSTAAFLPALRTALDAVRARRLPALLELRADFQVPAD